jgi:signal transduction histidine kinase/CheY-like chemotaxis protein
MRFLSTVDPPPLGFQLVDPNRRTLLCAPAVIFTGSINTLTQHLGSRAQFLQGILIECETELKMLRASEQLWHMGIPHSMQDQLRILLTPFLDMFPRMIEFSQNNASLTVLLDRADRAHHEALKDYQKATQRLLHKVTELTQSQQMNIELNRELEARVIDRTDKLAQANTELKTVNVQLNQAKKLAEAASAGKSLFLATMSHEIRTPMNGVIGMLELLVDSGLTTQQQELLTTARDSAFVLMNIVNDILDFSKIEANRMELEYAPMSIKAIIQAVTNALNPTAKKQQLRLSWTVAPEVPDAVLGDQVKLRQILYNLCSNAIKFTKTTQTQQGTVFLSAGCDEIRDQLSTVTLCIRDNGIGMSAKTVDKLFEPFTQADSSTSRQFGGTGLGLAICRSLVDLMGGTIDVASTINQGSEFKIRVPFVIYNDDKIMTQDNPSEPTQDRFSEDITQKLILVAEDNPINQLVIRKQLEKLGFQPVVVSDGAQALAFWKDNAVDLILSDCHMPEMDGFQLTQAIRQREQDTKHHTPIIAVTANALAGEGEHCMAEGMDDYLAKPFELVTLRQIIYRWFE